jgi:FtsP/CotA-like multicopper oxidase with cupredoxin domain
MTISRRQVLLIGGLGVLGAGAAMLPTGSVEAKSASRLSDGEMPRPFQAAFVQAPILQPYSTGIDPADGLPVNYYRLTEKAATAKILPRLTTPILGYNGLFPGPTISLDQGTKAVMRVRNQLRPSMRWTGTRFPRPPTCTGRRPCRSMTVTPAISRFRGSTRTIATPTSNRPARSGTTTMVSTSLPSTPIPAWRRSTTCMIPLNASCSRRAVTTWH